MLIDKQSALQHSESSFKIKAMIDKINQRIWVSDYSFTDIPAFSEFLFKNAAKFSAQKIIIPAREKDLEPLKEQGFILEGRAEGFLNGKTAYFMAAYPEPNRQYSPHLKKKMSELQKILSLPVKPAGKIPEGYTFRDAGPGDAPALAELFGKIFSTYPTPLDKESYILKLMKNSTIFRLAVHNNVIAAAGAAEMDMENSNAEMTNCATLPEHRGKGLMSIIIQDLEHAAAKRGIKCLYSLSRSSELGINLIFHRMGYTYSGTLINNCHICSTWEDMHLWVKATFMDKPLPN
ncbi:putative beta-lysine N-acetyltransferase [Desulfohalotomaculum tongense]|uniref:putative beta-lysine N-acetyltransferase n=1 Tax=Desulforadius tongensis TaxID=1216062 RepID=UPI00195A8A37|nr:putative beta-lysine N-acetyltransferase [Desulforadius tongensis]MBM7854627.1 putative beta-lysine N-acetyltransferase [Desulforadius tongensis]